MVQPQMVQPRVQPQMAQPQVQPQVQPQMVQPQMVQPQVQPQIVQPQMVQVNPYGVPFMGQLTPAPMPPAPTVPATQPAQVAQQTPGKTGTTKTTPTVPGNPSPEQLAGQLAQMQATNLNGVTVTPAQKVSLDEKLQDHYRALMGVSEDKKGE